MENKLKTLKDLQKDCEWKFDTFMALKQEAIKWIKELEKNSKKCRCKCGDILISDPDAEEYLICSKGMKEIDNIFDKYKNKLSEEELDNKSEKVWEIHDCTVEITENVLAFKSIIKIEFIKEFFNITGQDLEGDDKVGIRTTNK